MSRKKSENASDVGEDLPGDAFLEAEELYRVELAQMKLQLSGSLLREKRLEDKCDELALHDGLKQLQIKAYELQVARMHIQRANEAAVKRLNEDFTASGEKLEALKKTLGEKYNLDMSVASYDDVTGRLFLPPTSPKGVTHG